MGWRLLSIPIRYGISEQETRRADTPIRWQMIEMEKPYLYMLRSYVEESEGLNLLAIFACSVEFIPNDFEPIFPLRYTLAHELLKINLLLHSKYMLGQNSSDAFFISL